MSAKGPTKTPLHLMVLLFHDQTYGIHYEYTVSLNQSQESSAETPKEPEHLYLWTHSSWEDCSVHCGGGERKTVVSCIRMVNKTMTLVNESFCHPENRPASQVRRCNTHLCQYRWVAGDWGECSVTCGKGAQQREVGCVYQLQNGSFLTTRELYCLGVKPESIQHCDGRHCLTTWDASEWSQCSSNCGHGVRERTVTCRNPQGLCDPASRPTHQEQCEDYSKCFEWKTGDWSKGSPQWIIHLQTPLFSTSAFFKPTTCRSSLTTSINLLLGLSFFLLPGSSIFSILLLIYPMSLLCTCPNHLNLASLILSPKRPTCAVPLIN